MSFRLDRTAHHADTHEQAPAYLNSVVYGYALDNPPPA